MNPTKTHLTPLYVFFKKIKSTDSFIDLGKAIMVFKSSIAIKLKFRLGNLTFGKITEIVIPIIKLLILKLEVKRHQINNLNKICDRYLIGLIKFIIF